MARKPLQTPRLTPLERKQRAEERKKAIADYEKGVREYDLTLLHTTESTRQYFHNIRKDGLVLLHNALRAREKQFARGDTLIRLEIPIPLVTFQTVFAPLFGRPKYSYRFVKRSGPHHPNALSIHYQPDLNALEEFDIFSARRWPDSRGVCNGHPANGPPAGGYLFLCPSLTRVTYNTRTMKCTLVLCYQRTIWTTKGLVRYL